MELNDGMEWNGHAYLIAYFCNGRLPRCMRNRYIQHNNTDTLSEMVARQNIMHVRVLTSYHFVQCSRPSHLSAIPGVVNAFYLFSSTSLVSTSVLHYRLSPFAPRGTCYRSRNDAERFVEEAVAETETV